MRKWVSRRVFPDVQNICWEWLWINDDVRFLLAVQLLLRRSVRGPDRWSAGVRKRASFISMKMGWQIAQRPEVSCKQTQVRITHTGSGTPGLTVNSVTFYTLPHHMGSSSMEINEAVSLFLPTSEQNPEECDTTKAAQRTEPWLYNHLPFYRSTPQIFWNKQKWMSSHNFLILFFFSFCNYNNSTATTKTTTTTTATSLTTSTTTNKNNNY